jgi:hypothetical protein
MKYDYSYTNWNSTAWWNRKYLGDYTPFVLSLDNRRVQEFRRRNGWLE